MNEPVFPFPRRAESGVKPFAFAFPEEYDGECAAALAPLWTPVFDNLCVRSRNKCCTRSRLSAAVITPGGFVSVAGCVSKAGRGFDCSSGGDDLCLFSRSMISPRRASVSRPPSCAELVNGSHSRERLLRPGFVTREAVHREELLAQLDVRLHLLQAQILKPGGRHRA